MVAIAVIILPDMLDGKKAQSGDVFVSIPPAPSKKPIVNPEPFPEERVQAVAKRPVEIVELRADDDPAPAALEEATTNAVQTDTNPTTAPEPVPVEVAPASKPNAEAMASGWVIQLGTFRHKKNVEQLVKQLEGADYRVFTRPIKTSSGMLTKVFVGPDVNKSALERELPQLKSLTDLRGKVTEFSTGP